jgi:hypothetical protein
MQLNKIFVLALMPLSGFLRIVELFIKKLIREYKLRTQAR